MPFDVAYYDGMLGAWGHEGMGPSEVGAVTWQGRISQRDARARRLAAPDCALQEGLV